MICREFKHVAASYTLRELSLLRDEEMVRHAAQCATCESWWRQQRILAGALQDLSASTAGRGASPSVERALLQAFRQGTSEPVRSAPAPRFTPVALRLSRWFEVGAYAAVAAAIVIGVLLGARLWRESRGAIPRPVATIKAPVPPSQVQTEEAPTVQPATETAAEAPASKHRTASRTVHQSMAAATDSADTARTGESSYSALMLCDPLSCSQGTEIVRMEIPVTPFDGSGENQQLRMADVVVDYNGLVRAVRLVN